MDPDDQIMINKLERTQSTMVVLSLSCAVTVTVTATATVPVTVTVTVVATVLIILRMCNGRRNGDCGGNKGRPLEGDVCLALWGKCGLSRCTPPVVW